MRIGNTPAIDGGLAYKPARPGTDRHIPDSEIARQMDFLDRVYHQWTHEFVEKKSRKPLFAIQTYGCQMNERDSQHIRGMLERAGFEPGEKEEADLILFNTCCIREHAELKVFGNVGALQKRKLENPELMIAVCGCMMQQKEVAEKLYHRYPFVDMIFGTHALHAFAELLYHATLTGQRVYDVRESEGMIAENIPLRRDKSESAYLTIMYGCNNYCTFCIVPHVRGRERSRQMDDILREAQKLIREGVKEITLLGQNVNSYGNDMPNNDISFPQLLRQMNNLDGLLRLRFMTSHPKDLSPELINAMAECEKVCKHLHLPVQSGSDTILRKMNRRYTRFDYLALVDRLRAKIPDIELTTDIIVGFPGETEEDFEQTLQLVDQVGYSSAFTFVYSARNGTPAAKMTQIDLQTQKERLYRLNALQAEKTAHNNQKYIGKIVEVLVEGYDNRDTGSLFGKSSHSKMVYFPGNASDVGKLVCTKIIASRNQSLLGEQALHNETL